MPSEPMTAKRFAAKVEWEGGILEALDYGLKHTDLDPNDEESAALRNTWKVLEQKYAAMKPELNAVESILESLEEAGV